MLPSDFVINFVERAANTGFHICGTHTQLLSRALTLCMPLRNQILESQFGIVLLNQMQRELIECVQIFAGDWHRKISDGGLPERGPFMRWNESILLKRREFVTIVKNRHCSYGIMISSGSSPAIALNLPSATAAPSSVTWR